MYHHSQFAGELSCPSCGADNSTEVWPLNGDAVPFYFEESRGAYSVAVKCSDCRKTWFVVWDSNPGPIEKLEAADARSHEKPANPQLYLAVKVTVEQAIAQGVTDFDQLVQQAEKGLSGSRNMDEIRPLLRRAWLELHRGR